MFVRTRGGDVMQELTNKLNDILTDPQKYKKYQQDLAKYAWEQAQIFGYGGTLGQFLSTLCLGHIFQQGSSILDKARDKLKKKWCSRISVSRGFQNQIKIIKRP